MVVTSQKIWLQTSFIIHVNDLLLHQKYEVINKYVNGLYSA